MSRRSGMVDGRSWAFLGQIECPFESCNAQDWFLKVKSGGGGN